VLIQLRESSWTILDKNSATSVHESWDVVFPDLPEGGVRHASALNFTFEKEEVMIGQCQVM